MAAETAATRDKSRRVKNHILDRYLKLSDRVDQKGSGDLSEDETAKYWSLTEIFAKNVLPRTQEVTGDDGTALIVQIAKEVAQKNDINPSPSTDSQEPSEV